jgi:hypothetical protein
MNGGADAKGREQFQTFVETLADRLKRERVFYKTFPSTWRGRWGWPRQW